MVGTGVGLQKAYNAKKAKNRLVLALLLLINCVLRTTSSIAT